MGKPYEAIGSAETTSRLERQARAAFFSGDYGAAERLAKIAQLEGAYTELSAQIIGACYARDTMPDMNSDDLLTAADLIEE